MNKNEEKEKKDLFTKEKILLFIRPLFFLSSIYNFSREKKKYFFFFYIKSYDIIEYLWKFNTEEKKANVSALFYFRFKKSRMYQKDQNCLFSHSR